MRAGQQGERRHASLGRGGRQPSNAASALLFAVLAPLLIGVLLIGSGGWSTAGASATEASTSAPSSTPAQPTVDPDYPYAGYLRSTITRITPSVVTGTSGNMMTVSGTITNVSKGTLYDMRYVWQRGNALAGVTAIKAEIASPSRPSAVIGQNWQILSTKPAAAQQSDLRAGTSMQYVATVAINDVDGLAITQRGVYPLMIKISGDIGQNGATRYERVGEIHLLATVLSIPPGSPGTAEQPGTAAPSRNPGSAATGSNSAEAESSAIATTASPSSSATTTTDIPTQGLPSASSSARSSSAISGAAPNVTTTAAVPVIASTTGPAQPSATASAPATVSATGQGSETNPSPPTTSHPVALNLLWPLVDTPHVGIGGIFLDDRLAKELVPGGRLDQIVSDLTSLETGRSSTTVVIDPELLDEITQMSNGYRVVSPPGTPQAPLTPSAGPPTGATTVSRSATGVSTALESNVLATALPTTVRRPTAGAPATLKSPAKAPGRAGQTSTGSAQSTSPGTSGEPTSGTSAATPPPAGTIAGTGQQAAVAFLAKFRSAIAGQRIVVLPYSDPDSVAMIRAGLNVQLANLVSTGRVMAARLLTAGPERPRPVTSLTYPADEALDDATLAFLSSHGMTQALLSPTTLQHAGGPVGAVTINETGNSGQPVQAAVTDADVLPEVFDLIEGGAGTGAATRVDNLAAVLAGGSFDGSGTPLVIAPDKRWTANTAGLSLLTGLLRTLQTGGVLSGTPLTAIAAAAHIPATLDYPQPAQDAELDPAYLADVLHTTDWIHGVQASLTRARGDLTPAPADILGPLAAGMTSLGSAGLRPNDRIGRSILDTSRATLRGLQSGVAIAGGDSYLLASSASPLLITVRNDLPYVAEVRLVVIGGASVGLTATDPGPQKIPAGRSQQFKIATEVVKAGKFPLNIQLKAADGSDWSAPATITVSSSAYGTLTIVLIAVAGGALFLMVAIRLVQRVRQRRRPGDPPGEPSDDACGPVPPTSPAPDSILGAANAPPDPTPGPHTGAALSNPSGSDASSEGATGATRGDAVRPQGHQPGPSATEPGEAAP